MPYDEELNQIYDLIKNICENLNMNCIRADNLSGTSIYDDIIKSIENSTVIIADLTKLNPNVFYEIGYAHAIRKLEDVILICQKGEQLPFDLRHFRIILYTNDFQGASKLQTTLLKRLKERKLTDFEKFFE